MEQYVTERSGLPRGYVLLLPLVAVGQLAVAGELVIADFRSEEAARLGEMR